MESQEYNIENEIAHNRQMLEKRIPSHLNVIYLSIAENRLGMEPWQTSLTIDLAQSIDRNCKDLLETIGKDKMTTAAWIARNLLEIWVWVKYCGISKENAWRFHEDSLRDLKDLTEIHKSNCETLGINDNTFEIASQKIKEVASQELGMEDIDPYYLKVAKAAKADGVDIGNRFVFENRYLSKFAHPTAFLIHGILHQTESHIPFKTIFTTHGVYFAAQSTLALEAQFGIPFSDY